MDAQLCIRTVFSLLNPQGAASDILGSPMPVLPQHDAALDADNGAGDVTFDRGIDPLAGTQYRAVTRLGQGGMGEVFLADHVDLGRRFVVKLLHSAMSDNPRLVDRMRVEAQALARLEHPHIVQVNNFGKTPAGRPFIVMERLRGSTLADELRQRGAFNAHETIRLTRQLLSALEAAHGIGIVHRDIKLSNLFLHQPPGHPSTLKVLDFGIAKVLEGISENAPQPLLHPTEEGVVLGTPRYMSPEAILGMSVDHRSDLYSVGLVMYALLAGRGPWDHERRERDVLVAQARERPDPPSAYVPEPIPAELDRAVMKLLEKRPEHRFQSARELDVVLAGIESEVSLRLGHLDTSLYAAPETTPSPAPSVLRKAALQSGSRSVSTVQLGAARGGGDRTVPDIEPTQPLGRGVYSGPTLDLGTSALPVLPASDAPTRTAVAAAAAVAASNASPSMAPPSLWARARRAATRRPLALGLAIAVASTVLAWGLLDFLRHWMGN